MVTRDAATAGVILAGGRASRMGGRDKAFAAVDGEPIAVRTVRLFQGLFPQVIVATNRPERFAGFGVETVRRPPARLRPARRHPGRHAGEPSPVDVRGRVRHAGARRRRDPLAARTPACRPMRSCRAGRPTSSRCTRSTPSTRCPPCRSCLAAGRHALRDFLPAIRVDYVGEDELRALGGAARSLLNVNTPEELAALGGRFEEAER